MLAQRLAIGEVLLGHRLVNQDDRRAVELVAVVERAPLDERHADSAEIIRRDGAKLGDRRFARIPRRLTDDVEVAVDAAAPGDWQVVDRADRLDAGQPADMLLYLCEEAYRSFELFPLCVRRLVVGRRGLARERNVRREQRSRVEPRINFREPLDADDQ